MKTSNWSAFMDYCDYVSLTQLLLPLLPIVIRDKIWKWNRWSKKRNFLCRMLSKTRIECLSWNDDLVKFATCRCKKNWKKNRSVFFLICQNSRKCHCNCLGQQTLIRKNCIYFYGPKLILCESIFFQIFWYLNESTMNNIFIEYLNIARKFRYSILIYSCLSHVMKWQGIVWICIPSAITHSTFNSLNS